MPYSYIKQQMSKITEVLNDKELSNKKKLESIQSILQVLANIEKYSNITQQTKQMVINLRENLKDDSFYPENLLLEAAELVDYVFKVSEL